MEKNNLCCCGCNKIVPKIKYYHKWIPLKYIPQHYLSSNNYKNKRLIIKENIKEKNNYLLTNKQNFIIICQCGCGKEIPIKRSYAYTGLPKYLKYHGRKLVKRTDVQKLKISMSLRGRIKSKEHLIKIGNALRNKPKTKEHIRNIILSSKNKVYTEKEKLRFRQNGFNSIRKIRENRRKHPFLYCYFDSTEEKKCFMMLYRYKLINYPIEDKNVHIRVSRIEIDFKLRDGTYLDWHRFNTHLEKRTEEEYFNERCKILEDNNIKNGYCVIDSLSNLENFIRSKVEVD